MTIYRKLYISEPTQIANMSVIGDVFFRNDKLELEQIVNTSHFNSFLVTDVIDKRMHKKHLLDELVRRTGLRTQSLGTHKKVSAYFAPDDNGQYVVEDWAVKLSSDRRSFDISDKVQLSEHDNHLFDTANRFMKSYYSLTDIKDTLSYYTDKVSTANRVVVDQLINLFNRTSYKRHWNSRLADQKEILKDFKVRNYSDMIFLESLLVGQQRYFKKSYKKAMENESNKEAFSNLTRQLHSQIMEYKAPVYDRAKIAVKENWKKALETIDRIGVEMYNGNEALYIRDKEKALALANGSVDAVTSFLQNFASGIVSGIQEIPVVLNNAFDAIAEAEATRAELEAQNALALYNETVALMNQTKQSIIRTRNRLADTTGRLLSTALIAGSDAMDYLTLQNYKLGLKIEQMEALAAQKLNNGVEFTSAALENGYENMINAAVRLDLATEPGRKAFYDQVAKYAKSIGESPLHYLAMPVTGPLKAAMRTPRLAGGLITTILILTAMEAYSPTPADGLMLSEHFQSNLAEAKKMGLFDPSIAKYDNLVAAEFANQHLCLLDLMAKDFSVYAKGDSIPLTDGVVQIGGNHYIDRDFINSKMHFEGNVLNFADLPHFKNSGYPLEDKNVYVIDELPTLLSMMKASTDWLMSPFADRSFDVRSGFGKMRTLYIPSIDTTINRRHRGIDVKPDDYLWGEKVYIVAPAAGEIVYSGDMGQMGETDVIESRGKKIYLGHQKRESRKKRWVDFGDYVAQGDTLGEMGSTGWTTGKHLHIGLKIADSYGFIDPTIYFDPSLTAEGINQIVLAQYKALVGSDRVNEDAPILKKKGDPYVNVAPVRFASAQTPVSGL